MIRPAVLSVLLAALVQLPATAGDWESARQAFEAGDHETAIAALESLVATQPDWWAGHLMLGRSLVAVGRSGEGLERFERALALAPERGDVRLVLARTALAEGRPDRAAEVLEGQPTSGPQGALTARLLATARLETGDAAGALSSLAGARSNHPADPDLAALAARAARASGDLGTAVAVGSELVTLDPDPAHRRRLVADLQALAAVRETAQGARIELCSRAVREAEPLLGEAAAADDLLLAGAAASCAGEHERAVAWLEQARRDAPEDRRLLGALASALNRAARWEDTVDLLADRIGDGERGALALSLAIAFEGAGRFDEAIVLYESLDQPERLAAARERRAQAERNEKIRDLEDRERELLDMLENLEGSAAAPVT